jgi:hypothetical protein
MARLRCRGLFDYMRTSSRPDPVRRAVSKHHAREPIVRSQVATAFTIFAPRDINFAIVVYSECMQVDRLALIQPLGTTEGNMAKKAKKAKKSKKTAKKKKK